MIYSFCPFPPHPNATLPAACSFFPPTITGDYFLTESAGTQSRSRGRGRPWGNKAPFPSLHPSLLPTRRGVGPEPRSGRGRPGRQPRATITAPTRPRLRPRRSYELVYRQLRQHRHRRLWSPCPANAAWELLLLVLALLSESDALAFPEDTDSCERQKVCELLGWKVPGEALQNANGNMSERGRKRGGESKSPA